MSPRKPSKLVLSEMESLWFKHLREALRGKPRICSRQTFMAPKLSHPPTALPYLASALEQAAMLNAAQQLALLADFWATVEQVSTAEEDGLLSTVKEQAKDHALKFMIHEDAWRRFCGGLGLEFEGWFPDVLNADMISNAWDQIFMWAFSLPSGPKDYMVSMNENLKPYEKEIEALIRQRRSELNKFWDRLKTAAAA